MRPARAAVTVVFFLNGLLFGSWAGRIPAVRDRVDLSDGEQGVALAFIAIGAVVAMPVAGAFAARYGSRRPTIAALVLSCLAIGAIALSPSLAVLCLAAFLAGAVFGSLDVTMNAHGVTVERGYGRPILSSFHAAFSAGGLAGGALAAGAAAAAIDVRVHLGLVAAASLLVGLWFARRLLPAGDDAAPREDPLFVRPPRKLWALGAVAFACLLIEGATADWSAVYLRNHTEATAAAAALGFTAFSVTMTAGRLFGDRLVERFGAGALVRGGGLLAAAGFGVALLLDSPPAGIAGFAFVGAGMAAVVPVVFRAAGGIGGITAGVGIAAVSSMGYLGFMAGPPAIGGMAELTGLPVSLSLLVLLAAVVAALAAATEPRARRAPAVAEPCAETA